MFYCHKHNLNADFIHQSNCWVYGQLPTSSTSGLPWWISLLQGSDGMALKNFILEEKSGSSFQATTDITRWDPLTLPIDHICSDPGPKYEFSFKVTQAQ